MFEKYSAEFPMTLAKRFFDAFDANQNGWLWLCIPSPSVGCVLNSRLLCLLDVGLLDAEEFVCGMFILLRGTTSER